MANPAINYSEANMSAAQDRCVCLSVEFRSYGTQRTVDMNKVKTDADKTRISAKKQILNSDNIAAIHKIYGQVYKLLWTKCLASPLRKGTYLVPEVFIDEIEEKIKQGESEIRPFVQALKEELPTLKENDRRLLKSQFNEDDYPTEREIDESFYIDSQYLDFKVPDKLRTISSLLYNRQSKKLTQKWAEAAEDAQEFLRDTMKYIVDQFAKQLKIEKIEKKGNLKKGKEKRGRIYDSTMDNLRQFAEDFPARNLANDDRMLALVMKAKDLIDGIDASALRSDDGLRERVANEINSIQAEVTGLMNRPSRSIELE